MFEGRLVVIKGAGDLATGCAVRLFRCGFTVVMTEIAAPTVVRRAVSFAEAIYAGEATVEGIAAKRAADETDIRAILAAGKIAVLVDPEAHVVRTRRPRVLVDAIMAKRNLGTRIGDARAVIALGPGFRAGDDAHAVIETNRGHNLGRVIWRGEAALDTGVPDEVGGFGVERVLRAPAGGVLEAYRAIGDLVQSGDEIGLVCGVPVLAPFRGVVRGLIREGIEVTKGMKIGDVDPRASREHCFTVSDKALAVAGGVLEAILMLLAGPTSPESCARNKLR